MAKHIAVIGAGVAGFTAARRLMAAGLAVTVFEKARGAGGRLATRRFDGGGSADHGAQYFKISDADFKADLDSVPDMIAEWTPRVERARSTGAAPWFVGTPGMNSWLKALGGGVPSRFSTRITDIVAGDTGCILVDDTGCKTSVDGVLITAPPAQTADLVARIDPSLARTVADVTMLPNWTVMLGFDGPLEADFDIWQGDHPLLGWAACNTSKPGRDKATASWTLQATPDFSTKALEWEKPAVEDALCGAFAEILDRVLPMPTIVQAHRWLYALAANPLDTGYLASDTAPVFVAGDWCYGARVEDAYLSGRRAADAMLHHFT